MNHKRHTTEQIVIVPTVSADQPGKDRRSLATSLISMDVSRFQNRF
jgi:hypothetical protein